MFIGLYVDDLFISANDKREFYELKLSVTDRFSVKDLGPLKYFLGLQIHHDMILNVLTLNQTHFTQRINDRFGFKDCNSVSTPTNTSIKLS